MSFRHLEATGGRDEFVTGCWLSQQKKRSQYWTNLKKRILIERRKKKKTGKLMIERDRKMTKKLCKLFLQIFNFFYVFKMWLKRKFSLSNQHHWNIQFYWNCNKGSLVWSCSVSVAKCNSWSVKYQAMLKDYKGLQSPGHLNCSSNHQPKYTAVSHSPVTWKVSTNLWYYLSTIVLVLNHSF